MKLAIAINILYLYELCNLRHNTRYSKDCLSCFTELWEQFASYEYDRRNLRGDWWCYEELWKMWRSRCTKFNNCMWIILDHSKGKTNSIIIATNKFSALAAVVLKAAYLFCFAFMLSTNKYCMHNRLTLCTYKFVPVPTELKVSLVKYYRYVSKVIPTFLLILQLSPH